MPVKLDFALLKLILPEALNILQNELYSQSGSSCRVLKELWQRHERRCSILLIEGVQYISLKAMGKGRKVTMLTDSHDLGL